MAVSPGAGKTEVALGLAENYDNHVVIDVSILEHNNCALCELVEILYKLKGLMILIKILNNTCFLQYFRDFFKNLLQIQNEIFYFK